MKWALLRKLLYWLAVVAISVALVVALLLYFASRDEPSLNQGRTARPAAGA